MSAKSGLRGWLAGRLPTLAAEVAAVVALLSAAVADSPLWALPPALIAVGLLGYTWRNAVRGGSAASGSTMVIRLLLLACAYLLGVVHSGAGIVLALGVGGAALAVLAESAVTATSRSVYPVSANLRGSGLRPNLRPNTSRAVLVNGFAVVVALGCGFLGTLEVVSLVVSAAALALIGFTGWQAVTRVRARHASETRLNAALAAYEPAFLLHWEAPAGTAYQVGMWLPYLERLGKKFFVLVRSEANFNEVLRLTTAPVVLRAGLTQIDDVIVPSLRAAFYVNTATKNNHLVRYTNLTHIQLNHGDSDKVPSHNPVFRMYDRNFVAGQAAIDRFAANGVSMPAEMFRIVGRPQVENVAIAAAPIASLTAPRVLYAPTWAGFYADSNYSSLLVGYDIVKALIARGCSIVFRPHPYTIRSAALTQESERIKTLLAEDARTSGRKHLFGAQAESKMSVVDCFNASDAMVSDVSSVVADYLYSEKPFAMVAVSTPADRFTDAFPLARAAYVIDAHTGRLSGLDLVLDDLLGSDPLAATRHDLKKYYLGDIPAEGYAQHFLDEANSYL
ncbi:CDP-glycerol glycerophosphotransferase family protein [Micromonospora sp. NPDC047134]|uniref:CDP-glycerol glycerophosphotransferase family protein n=1 Tax=Micromonospora sp. NPDC047134 TaxID=3154340 RepID=UPI0033E508A8